MECSTSRRSLTATVHVRRTTCRSVTYSPFVRHSEQGTVHQRCPSTRTPYPAKRDSSGKRFRRETAHLAKPICHNLPMCGRYRLSRRKQLVQEYFETVS